VIVSIIVAMDERRGIGKAGKLPWHLSADLKRFRDLTMGHHLIVGRRTFDSIGKPLPGRKMIVMSRDPAYCAQGCDTATTLEQAIELARQRGDSEVFIGGGADVYRAAVPLADRIYLTQVHAVTDADTFFPDFDRGDWAERLVETKDADEKNQFDFTFFELRRK
jgi:dihydrofolate reductase